MPVNFKINIILDMKVEYELYKNRFNLGNS